MSPAWRSQSYTRGEYWVWTCRSIGTVSIFLNFQVVEILIQGCKRMDIQPESPLNFYSLDELLIKETKPVVTEFFKISNIKEVFKSFLASPQCDDPKSFFPLDNCSKDLFFLTPEKPGERIQLTPRSWKYFFSHFQLHFLKGLTI